MQPINNKYTKWYFNLIETRLNRVTTGYTENHHIIPKSLGGNNHKSNIVALYPKEHFIAHLLLSKMFIDENNVKMKFAFNMMLNNWSQQRYQPTSRLYAIARDAAGSAFSQLNKGRIPWNKGLPRDNSLKEAVSKANTGRTAWNKGRLRTEEEKQKMRDGWAKRKDEIDHTPHNKGKILGPLTDDHKEKISKANTGRTAWNKGKQWKKKSKGNEEI